MTQDEGWMIRYKEVMEFMERERLIPSKCYPEEKPQFHFHHKKKLNNSDCLKPERVEKFEKLFALCEEYKRVN